MKGLSLQLGNVILGTLYIELEVLICQSDGVSSAQGGTLT
jgi:hypothetical protein